ncbi:mediator of RNA polymerase II transcription subunit 11-like [Mytilus galloprovincialis]|uniref:Mediator of RNA polymerase II transcription subunit 11 n=1 Tax=Mytilus galloprovincialis TaxID=29158 RepID=A0A8B6HD74_MYTGA|nr:mediator of RNA polymerase II transcription subunit 11 [Mytilus galloprovincialis]
MGSGPVERIQQLDIIEREIATAIHSAGLALQELAKEKPQAKQIETHTTTFMKTLMEVEKKMTNHINYLTQVSTGQPHEGSSYAASKDLTLAYHRIDHIKSRLATLERFHHELSPQKPHAKTLQMSDS